MKLAALKDAFKFTQTFNWFEIKHKPVISFVEDGEVNFSWNTPEIKIDLGFYGTGTYSYYAKFADGRELMGDDTPTAKPLPVDILKDLR